VYICSMSNKKVVVFNVSERTFDIYGDVKQAADKVGMKDTTLGYNIRRSGVYYTGGFFVGYGSVHRSRRGLR